MTDLDRCARCQHYRGNHVPNCRAGLRGGFDCDCVGFVEPGRLEGPGQARASDPPTSHEAAVVALGRKGNARRRLLRSFAGHPAGLTDEEAAAYADLSLRSEYATRCSELRRLGLIEATDQTRVGESGSHRMVSRITDSGVAEPNEE
jgi:hypothetical protein